MLATIPATLTDQTITTDMLDAAKTSIKDLAAAITEAASPQVKAFLMQEFNTAVASQEKIYAYMQSKGWYNAFTIGQQIQNDINNANVAMSL